MTIGELIAKLTALPDHTKLICVDLPDEGFMDIEDVSYNAVNPGALIVIEDDNEARRAVRSINTQSE